MHPPDLAAVSATEPKQIRTLRRPGWRSDVRKVLIWKRILLMIVILSQMMAYSVLTEARYAGQGLVPRYFRLTTVGDILSLALPLLLILLSVRSMIRPRWVSLGRCILAAVWSLLLLWLDFGVRRFEATDFPAVGSLSLIIALAVFIALLITRNSAHRSFSKRWLSVAGNSVLVLAVLVVFGFIYSFFYPNYSEPQEIKPFDPDAGVVLGAAVWSGKHLGDRPSPTLRERMNVGYELLQNGLVPKIVVTGGNAPGELSEAEVAKREYLRQGIDESSILTETMSRSTLEQVLYIRDELVRKQGWSRFVIVSDQYHLARVIEMCRFNGIWAIGDPSRIQQPFLDLAYYRLRESVALLAYWLLGK